MTNLGNHARDCEGRPSDQPQPLEARMPVPADDDVIVHRDPEWLGGADDRMRHVDIGARRGGVARRMIVEHTTNLSI